MANELKGFLFYRSYLQAFRNLPDADRLALYDAIAFYALEDIEPTFEQSYCEAIFQLIRPNIETNRKRYENGKKAKQKQTGSKTEAKAKQTGSKTEANRENTNTNTNTNKNTNTNTSIKRFTPPTLEEVKAYCLESGHRIDAERFIDYYESNGWMVGRNKMKDWKAAVRNWAKREDEKPKKEERRDPYEDVDFSWLREIHQVGG